MNENAKSYSRILVDEIRLAEEAQYFSNNSFLACNIKNSITFVYGMHNGLWSNRILGDIYHNDLLMVGHNKNNHHVSIFDLFVALYFVKVIYCRKDDT